MINQVTPALQHLIRSYVKFCFIPSDRRKNKGYTISKGRFENAVDYGDFAIAQRWDEYSSNSGGLYVCHDDFINIILAMNVGFKAEPAQGLYVQPHPNVIRHFAFTDQFKRLHERRGRNNPVTSRQGWYWQYFIENDVLAKLKFHK